VVATVERIPKLTTPQLELMLDASGSMQDPLKRKRPRKIDIAKEAMAQIIEGLPDGLPVALHIFGHRIRERQPGDCQDSELVVPFAPLNKPRLRNQLWAIQALGTTPIAYSLQQVEHDFGGAPGEKIVILVTDGKEECKGHPSAVISELLAKGFQVRLHVVGFALGREADKREMRQLAEPTGGRFFDAQDGQALRGAIEQALAVPYDVLDAAGSRVASGLTGQGAITVPEGVYTVVVHVAGQPIRIADVRVTYDQFTRVELKKEGQEVGTQVLGPVQKNETPRAAEAKAGRPSPRRK
jgi:von Willebrand factor type A domain